MGLFQQINSGAQQCKLPFVVIGGLAVNFYGVSRDTADLDLLICGDARGHWLSLFAELGYEVLEARGAFVQLSPPQEGAWPVDLMLVAAPTFEPICACAKQVEIYGESLFIPSLEHLLALKLHALKHTHSGRFLKDYLDVENLLKANKLDPRSEKIRKLFEKYGTMDLHGKVSRSIAEA